MDKNDIHIMNRESAFVEMDRLLANGENIHGGPMVAFVSSIHGLKSISETDWASFTGSTSIPLGSGSTKDPCKGNGSGYGEGDGDAEGHGDGNGEGQGCAECWGSWNRIGSGASYNQAKSMIWQFECGEFSL